MVVTELPVQPIGPTFFFEYSTLDERTCSVYRNIRNNQCSEYSRRGKSQPHAASLEESAL